MGRVKSLLFASTVFASAMLNSTSARASETIDRDSAALIALFGHALLAPAYVSVMYYGAVSDKPMGKGWVATNIVTSVLAGIVGIAGVADGASGSKTSDRVALGAGLFVLAGTAVVVTGTAIQGGREKRSSDSSSVMILPSVSSTQTRDTTFGLVAIGRF